MSYSIEAWKWLVSPAARRYLDDLSQVESWRRDLTQEQISLLAMQARLRALAARKIDRPDAWIWTEKLLEQASDAASSAWVAAQMPRDRPIFDLCCGAGADSVAFAKQNPLSLHCADVDPVACLLTRYHLDHVADAQEWAQVHQRSAEETELPKEAWVHIDPDRRSQGKRTTHLTHYHPPQAFLDACLHTRGGSMKLAPGSDIPSHWESQVAVEWIGVGKSVRQQRLWWGETTLEPATRAVTLLDVPGATGPIQQAATLSELHSTHDCMEPDWESEPWIGDCHPAVRAADMTPWIAVQHRARVVGDRFGYVTTSEAKPTPWIDWFQVEDRFPLDAKKLRRAMQARRIGQLEIKKRGVEVDPESLRKSLKLNGDQSATLILMRAGKQRSAILARRPEWPP